MHAEAVWVETGNPDVPDFVIRMSPDDAGRIATNAGELVLVRLAVRETLETYLNALDTEDWDAVARCFADDAVSHFNHEPEPLHGGRDVADWLRRALEAATGTNHTLSNLRTEIDRTAARCDSRVMATLHWGKSGVGRVSVRAIRYRDELVEVDGVWLIRRRLHEPQWQYEALSSPPRLQ